MAGESGTGRNGTVHRYYKCNTAKYKPTITKEGLVLWLNQIQTISLETKEHKQRLIDCFVNAVYLYDDKLVITFNYKEATKTVTLKEVNGSIIECAGVPKKERAIVLSFFGTPEGTQLYSPSASYIGYASYICFASDIGLRPALEANII